MQREMERRRVPQRKEKQGKKRDGDMEPLHHFSHVHPLFLSEGNIITINGSDDCEEIVCKGCKLNISSSTHRYSCNIDGCSFFLHKTCAELPNKIEPPILHRHELHLEHAGLCSFCSVCGKEIEGFKYECLSCFLNRVNAGFENFPRGGFQIDIICARRIFHYSQKHPLVPCKLVEEAAGSCCCVCFQPIKITKGSSSIYRCTTCDLYSHKFCAQLPTEKELKKHPLHPEHSLILLPNIPIKSFTCAACDQYLLVFGYRCSHSGCNFSLHLTCALRILQSVEINECHKHPLTPLFTTALFHCHGCGEEHEGHSYLCNTCGFWIHEDCVSLPTTITHHSHCHPLTRCFSDRCRLSSRCAVCEKQLYKNSWIYHCESSCDFYIHVKCSTGTRKRKTKIKVEDLQETNPIRLPMADNSINPIDRFMSQRANITGTEKSGDIDAQFEKPVSHFSHIHPLILFNVQVDSNLCSGSKILVSSENYKDETICDACVRPIISSPFYGCKDCNFFLHDYCANLNKVLKHPYHPHTLNLVGKRPSVCHGCLEYCNGFIFSVLDRYINYCLDLKCALLPKNIIHQEHPLHEDHEHPLYLWLHEPSEGCVACDKHPFTVFSYVCVICSFSLHYYCALLPRTIRHRYDKHPFTLISAPIPDGPDQYVCEFCENDINPRWWFYHCIDCDKSACAKCIFKEEREFPTIKWGSKYKLDVHEHPLTLVQATKKSPLCSKCNKKFDGTNLNAFECSQCDIIFHQNCACSNFWNIM